MSKRDVILGSLKYVESVPPFVGEAVSLLNDPDAEIPDLARLIELDPALTANLLRIANSAHFAGVRTFESVGEAILRLGFTKSLQLALAVAMAPCVGQEIKGYDLPAAWLLHHSIAVASGAEEVAEALEIKAPAHTFTAGLLAGIGKIVLGTHLEIDAEEIMAVAQDEDISFHDAESIVLGINHAEVGAALLTLWGLPESITTIVRYHLLPSVVGHHSLALDLVHAGTLLARMSGVGLGLDGLDYEPDMVSLARLGVTREVMDIAAAAVCLKLGDLCDAFCLPAAA